MTVPRHIAVVDIGKTNIKVALVDAEHWTELDVRTAPNTVLRSPPYPHFDTASTRRFVITSLAELNREIGVDAISVTAHGAAGALLDSEGELALPILDYEYDGPDVVADDYDSVRPPFAETGSPKLAGGLNLGAQLFWQMRRFPRAWKKVSNIVTLAQFWSQTITGVATTEVTSLGCHTDLWSPDKADFSSMVDALGWRSLMAPVHKSGNIVGTVSAAIASQTGLDPDTPVSCGIHDSNASLYPHLVHREQPFAVVSTGTWVIAMNIGGDSKALDPDRDTLVNVNAFGNSVPSARFMGGREFDLMQQNKDAECSASALDTIHANSVMLLPAVENRTGPFQRVEHCWTVDPATLSKEEVFAAVSSYLAMMTTVCLDMIGAAGPVVVEGPFASNSIYRAQLASAIDRPLCYSHDSATGTSIGAAMLAIPPSQLNYSPCDITETGNAAMRNFAHQWLVRVAEHTRS